MAIRDSWGHQDHPGANRPKHPFVEDVYRTDPIPMDAIVTRTTAIGSARHLVKMATARTRLRRVRFANLDELDTVTTELVF